MGNKISDRLDLDIGCENNGLVLKGYHLPEEIICEILSNISGKDVLNFRLVCKRWSDIINFVVLNSYKRTFATIYANQVLPFDLRYITLYGNIYNRNLLKNVNGEEKLKYWTILEIGDYRIEDPPQGSDQLPENIEEFKGHTSCFASSFGLARKQQVIDIIKNRHLSLIVNKYKPHIYVSEWVWVGAQFDCSAKYQICLQIQCENGQNVEKNINHQLAQWEGSTWKKLEFIIEEYPDDVELITFEHQAKHPQFWGRHYGMKMAGAVVKLLLDKIKL